MPEEHDAHLNKRDEMIGRYLAKGLRASKMAECQSPLEDEEIAAFIDGKLDAEERKVVMDHLSACSECYEVFSETINVQEDLTHEFAWAASAKEKLYSSRTIKVGEYLFELAIDAREKLLYKITLLKPELKGKESLGLTLTVGRQKVKCTLKKMKGNEGLTAYILDKKIKEESRLSIKVD